MAWTSLNFRRHQYDTVKGSQLARGHSHRICEHRSRVHDQSYDQPHTLRQVNPGTLINASGSWTLAAGDPAVTAVQCYFLFDDPNPPNFPGAMTTGMVKNQKQAYLTGGQYVFAA